MKTSMTRAILLCALGVLLVVTAATGALGQTPCPAAPNYVPDFSSNQNCLTLNSSPAGSGYPGFYPPAAPPVVPNPPPQGVMNVLRLTPNSNYTSGSAWFNSPQPLSAGFSTTFTFQLSGATGGDPADGFAFLIQNSSAGTSALDPDNGSDGCSLGFGDAPDGSCTGATGGITNSVAIAFDIYQNPTIGDPNNNHVEIDSCGTGANSVENPPLPGSCQIADNANLPITLADGNIHTVMIKYSPATTTGCGEGGASPCPGSLDVTLDGTDLFPGGVPFDVATLGLTSNNGTGFGYVGFTGATGEGNVDQDIQSWLFAPTQQGQPINQNNPGSLTQNFVINNTSGENWQFGFDYSVANNGDPLTVQLGTTPYVGSQGISPTDWASIVQGTAMADAPCLIAAGQTVCAVNTYTCTTSANPIASGANCPVSSARNVLFDQEVDLNENQPGITNGVLTIPRGYAPGFAMAPDTLVPGAECTYPSDSPLAGQACPENILTTLEDPTPRGGGTATTTNSTYVFFCCEPEWQTTPSIALWSNSTNVPASFTSMPPATPNPDPNNFHAAQGAFVVVGAEPHGTVLDTTYPLPGEQSLNNSTPCPALGTPPATPWSTQNPQTFSVNGFITNYDNNGTAAPLAEGAYDAHYFSVDCDSFEELVYPQTLDITPGTPGPNVASFKTVPFNIDTTKPNTPSISLSSPGGFYAQSSALTAMVTCTDPSSPTVPNFFSGIAVCGPQNFGGNQQTVVTTPIPLDTSTVGTHTFMASATDAAGNSSGPASITYQVVGSADLGVIMLANLKVETGTSLTYYLTVWNNGPSTADEVTITDTLPSGTTFVSSGYAIESCSFGGGNPSCSITPPKNSCGGAAGSCSIGALAAWTPKNPTAAVVQITVNVTAKPNTTITNSAVVSEANSDPKLQNNTAKWPTLVTK
ncbi:MAG TPA: hypothetical protein VMU61_02235 [Candidatus Aquilonibacter sp.]|nr:hypothetical protein [Candidatus Aquilonibacter sp.]